MASLMFRSKRDNRYYSEGNRPSGSGSWYVFYYDTKGKKVRQRIGPSKRTAELAKGDIEARLEKQRAGLIDPEKELRHITVLKSQQQLPDLLRTENKAPKTISRYTVVLGHLIRFLEEHEPYLKRLDQIEPAMFERYKDFRRSARITSNGHPNAPQREGISVRTLNNEIMYLKTIFNLAKRRGFIHHNPLDEVRKINGQGKKRYQPLTQDQIQELLNAADADLRPILLTLLLTGMRTGELLNLEWGDLDFEREEIHIRAKEDWQPKDKEARMVPMHHELKPVFKTLKESSDSRYVFGKGDQKCPNKLLIRLQRTCRRAGIPEITVHNLRDEFASHLVMQGVGIETVSQLLGHSSIEITWNHYVHLAPQKLKSAVEELSWSGP